MKKLEFLDKKFRPIYDFNLLYIPSLFCSFGCEYCPTYDNSYKLRNEYFIKHKEFIHYLENFYESKNKNISLYGGEPTENINIVDFINEFKDKWKFTILTNLQLNETYLKNIIKIIDNKSLNFIISLHLHRVKNLNEFEKKLNILISNKNIITLRIMIEKNQKEQILYLFKKYYEKYDNLKLINRLIYPIEKYCDFELYNVLKDEYENSNFKIKFNKKNYNLRNFIDSKENNFEGYFCEAGKHRLVLNYNGDIYFCETAFLKDKYKITNIFNDLKWKEKIPLKNYVICPFEQCRCELYLKKWKDEKI